CGLTCYSCTAADPKYCTDTEACSAIFNRCYSIKIGIVVNKGCLASQACIPPMTCCEGNLCNGAVPTGPGVIVLLLSSALITLFI
ncbi:hypothetical protein XENOCAPTIV_029080, partial [Xenoophorus captivus]